MGLPNRKFTAGFQTNVSLFVFEKGGNSFRWIYGEKLLIPDFWHSYSENAYANKCLPFLVHREHACRGVQEHYTCPVMSWPWECEHYAARINSSTVICHRSSVCRLHWRDLSETSQAPLLPRVPQGLPGQWAGNVSGWCPAVMATSWQDHEIIIHPKDVMQ